MDRANLLVLLRGIHSPLVAARGSERRVPGWRRSYGFELERTVAALIDIDPALPVSRPFGGVHLSINGSQLAKPLLDTLVETGPDAALAWLEKVSSTDTADVRVVVEVRGLHVSGVLELPGNVRVSQPAQAPQSTRIRELDPALPPEQFMRRSLEPPTSVAWVDCPGLAWKREKAGDKSFRRAAAALHHAMLAMVLVPQQAPLIVRTWTEFADPDLEHALNGRGWYSGGEDGAPLDQPAQQVIQAHLAPVARLLSLPRSILDHLTLPLSRLGLARRRRQAGNQAIELCTALEAIFGDRDEKTELSYRLRLRAALFLGETVEARKRIREQIRDLYSLRSGQVHGTGKARFSPAEAGELIATGNGFVVQAIGKIAEQRALPVWSQLEINPPPLKE